MITLKKEFLVNQLQILEVEIDVFVDGMLPSNTKNNILYLCLKAMDLETLMPKYQKILYNYIATQRPSPIINSTHQDNKFFIPMQRYLDASDHVPTNTTWWWIEDELPEPAWNNRLPDWNDRVAIMKAKKFLVRSLITKVEKTPKTMFHTLILALQCSHKDEVIEYTEIMRWFNEAKHRKTVRRYLYDLTRAGYLKHHHGTLGDESIDQLVFTKKTFYDGITAAAVLREIKENKIDEPITD